MKEFIPTEEDFELLMVALSSYEKEMVAKFAVDQYLKRMENLNNEQAFLEAFAKKPTEVDQAELLSKSKAVRDKVVVIAAKLVQLRDYTREKRLSGAIEDLLK